MPYLRPASHRLTPHVRAALLTAVLTGCTYCRAYCRPCTALLTAHSADWLLAITRTPDDFELVYSYVAGVLLEVRDRRA